MLQNKQSPIVQATEIVSCQVTGFIKDFFSKDRHETGKNGCPITMKNIHIYLSQNLDILSKKLILFPLNKGRSHWNGWAAVNPWVQLARVLYEHTRPSKTDKKEYSFCHGYHKIANDLISCDGMQTKGIADTRCIIWFLNLASAYSDMVTDKAWAEFNYLNHTPRTYWVLGCSGPFGKLDVRDDSKITYKILTLHKDIKPKQMVQTDWFNCGLIWCLFVFDIMLQVTELYYGILPDGSRELPLSLGIGKSWLHPRIYANLLKHQKKGNVSNAEENHYKMMCIDLREELVCLLEKLCLLRLQSFSNHIEIPENWGVFHPIFSKNLMTSLRRVVMACPGKDVLS